MKSASLHATHHINIHKENFFCLGQLEVSTGDGWEGQETYGKGKRCHTASGRTRTFPGPPMGHRGLENGPMCLPFWPKGVKKTHFQPGKCHFCAAAETRWGYQLRVTLWSHLRPLRWFPPAWAPHQFQTKFVLASRLSCSRGSLGKQPSHLKIHFHPAASARLECNLGLGKHGFTCFN